MTPEELLSEATKAFEATFENVLMGPAATNFTHNGQRRDYLEVSGEGAKSEGERLPIYDTPEAAIFALQRAWRQFEGKKFLYWRVRPEIDQDTTENMAWMGEPEVPNPTFGKWKVYSRFRAID